jgi:hypothetical protein
MTVAEFHRLLLAHPEEKMHWLLLTQTPVVVEPAEQAHVPQKVR